MKHPWYSHAHPCVFSWIFYGTDHGSSMGTGPLIFHGKPMEYFCKGGPFGMSQIQESEEIQVYE